MAYSELVYAKAWFTYACDMPALSLHTAVDAYIFCELFGSTANRTKPADIPQVYMCMNQA